MRLLPLVVLVAACVKPPEPAPDCVATSEVCNGADDDCDGYVDNFPSDGVTTFVDADGDGRGDGSTPLRSCDPGAGRVEDGTDCDDADATSWIEVDGYADRDLDGYGDAESPVSGCGSAGVDDFTDCDDRAADVNPSGIDVPGDGVDQDCDGDDAIGDRDGDGYDLDDCDDADPRVFPGADDVWYDGIDANCDGADDFDQDGDGFRFEQDCDDSDAAVYPGASPDVFGDGVDTDCSGDEGVDIDVDFGFGGYSWENVRNVVVARNDLHWVIITAAGRADPSDFANSAVALIFESTGAPEPFDALTWFVPQLNQTVQVAGQRVDADSSRDGFYAGLAYTNSPTCRPEPCTPPSSSTYVMMKRVYWDANQAGYRNRLVYRQISALADAYVDVDLRAPVNGNPVVLACGSQSAGFVIGDATAQFSSVAKGCVGAGNCSPGPLFPVAPTSCFVEPSDADAGALGTLCDAATCGTYALTPDAMTLANAQPYATRTWRTQESRGDWVVRTSADGVSYFGPSGSGTALAGLDVLDAEIYESEGRVFIAAVVPDQDGDGARDVALAWGVPGAPFAQAVFPAVADGVVVDVFSAALATEGPDTLLAVSGRGPNGDLVAWAWVKLP